MTAALKGFGPPGPEGVTPSCTTNSSRTYSPGASGAVTSTLKPAVSPGSMSKGMRTALSFNQWPSKTAEPSGRSQRARRETAWRPSASDTAGHVSPPTLRTMTSKLCLPPG